MYSSTQALPPLLIVTIPVNKKKECLLYNLVALHQILMNA